LGKDFREKMEEISSLIKNDEIRDYASLDVVWDDDRGYIIENENEVLDEMVWNGLTQSEAKTRLKEYKEILKKASSMVKELVNENVISSEDEIWDYIDEEEDYYDDEDED